MRNIALLEWGPASLFHIQPRERIKVRTGWLEGGPRMPPFLSTMEDAKSDSSDLCVRYALSAFEDLNGAIRNLRRCFGFPYQEYIGYLNTLTRTHRVRREHEGLIANLRRWAIFGNVDAVFWIDYAKANQPPGSFKMGPWDSRPFSANHMEICMEVTYDVMAYNDGDESDVAWSEVDDEHPSAHAGQSLDATAAALRSQHHDASAQPLCVSLGGLRIPLRRRGRASLMMEEEAAAAKAQGAAGSKEKEREKAAHKRLLLGKKDERSQLRAMIQEEVVPGHGGIYQRSMNPGPGYYSPPDFLEAMPEGAGPSFGRKHRNHQDAALEKAKEAPGPGDYRAKPEMVDEVSRLGRFSKADRMPPKADMHRKLPYISAMAAKAEMYGIHGDGLLGISPTAPFVTSSHQGTPHFSFGRMRRPF